LREIYITDQRKYNIGTADQLGLAILISGISTQPHNNRDISGKHIRIELFFDLLQVQVSSMNVFPFKDSNYRSH